MERRAHQSMRVLVVDDQKEIHDDFVEMLNPNPVERSTEELMSVFMPDQSTSLPPEFELSHATSGEEACVLVEKAVASDRPVAVAYVDIRMPPGIDGIETIQRMRRIDQAIEIVIMTAYTDRSLPEIIRGLELLHKVLYMRKPFSREEIQQITLALVEKWNVEQELARKRLELTDSHQRLEAVLDATGDAIALYDAAGRLAFSNQGYEKLFGLPRDELKKMSPAACKAWIKGHFRTTGLPEKGEPGRLGESGSALEATTGGQVPKGGLFYRSIAPVRDEQGNIIGDLHVYRDVSKEIEVERMKAENLRLRSELQLTHAFGGIVGNSREMQKVYALMQRAAESDITTLISGESGTGKELIARTLHFNSARKEGPFLAINCAAIPETLIESELFGHERGAFTGALRQRPGIFERAEGGTVFLDEVGDMPRALQVRLLRVLQEREVQRVGGTTTIPVDVRVTAATNKNLEAMVRTSEFREDLFYRLAAFPIMIPPLRDRREDVLLLAEHFLKKHAGRSGRRISGLSVAASRLLAQHDWPGNVRELENAIERGVLLESTEVLQADNLPSQLLPIRTSRSGPSEPTAVLPLAQLERQALVHALEAAANNVTEAAQSLGIHRATLYRKLKQYGLLARP